MVLFLILKNLLIFFLGVLFTSICFSLLSAYHLYKSRQMVLDSHIHFIEDRETGIVFWNRFPNYKSALHAWYIALVRRLFGSKKDVCYSDNTRARRLFLFSIITLFIVLILVLWLIFNINIIEQ